MLMTLCEAFSGQMLGQDWTTSCMEKSYPLTEPIALTSTTYHFHRLLESIDMGEQ